MIGKILYFTVSSQIKLGMLPRPTKNDGLIMAKSIIGLKKRNDLKMDSIVFVLEISTRTMLLVMVDEVP